MGVPEAFTRTTDVGHWIGGAPTRGSRTRSQLHHLEGYYPLRNHIVDFLVSRAKAH